MSGYRYGPYAGGPDPLEPPYDVRGAVDALGESVLDGTDPASALRDLGLPRDNLVVALVSFNLGVEAGQLAIVAALLPLAIGRGWRLVWAARAWARS